MPHAADLLRTSANAVNILAPYAETVFSSGLVTGSLIVGGLQGGGQVNLGHFDGGPPVPEPGTLALLGAGACALIRRRVRR